MKRALIIIIFLFGSLFAKAQVNSQGKTTPVSKIYADTAVEVKPEFPGGTAGLWRYLQKNIHYPIEAYNANIQGRVFVSMVIEKDGSVSNAKVVKKIDSDLDREALRVVNSFPKWKPGINNGEVVRTKWIIPISFKIANSQ